MSQWPETERMFHAPIHSDELTYQPSRRRLEPEALIRQYRDLVRKIAWHVHSGTAAGIELEDLIQIGLMALVEAAQSFEDRGLSFSSYASTRIRGAMIDQVRREATISRTAMANQKKLAAVRRTLEGSNGRPATDAEMIAALEVDAESYHAMVLSCQSVRHESVDDLYEDDQAWFADLRERADEQIEREQLRHALATAIAALPKREATVLQLYFVEECNLDEIGAILEVGAARVCQLKKAALQKVRAALANEDTC